MSWFATWIPAVAIVEQAEDYIKHEKEDYNDVAYYVKELSCADLVRNYPTFLKDTKKQTVEAIIEQLGQLSTEDKRKLMVLRDKLGFCFITTLPYVNDAEHFAPDADMKVYGYT